jgi:ribonuclease HI
MNDNPALTGGFSVVTLDKERSSSWAWVGVDGLVLHGICEGVAPGVRIRGALAAFLEEIDSHCQQTTRVVMTAHSQVLSAAKRTAQVRSGRILLEDERECGSRHLYRSARAAATWDSWERRVHDVERATRLVGAADRPVVIATDGSFDPVTGIGTWCWYVSDKCHSVGVSKGRTSGCSELSAIHDALSHVAPGAEATILSDCQGVIRALGFTNNGTKTRTRVRRRPTPAAFMSRGVSEAEEELREATRQLIGATGARVRWVQGHNGHGLHTHADLQARAALRAYSAYQELIINRRTMPRTFLLRLADRARRRTTVRVAR